MTPQETLRRALLNDEFPEDVAADRLFTPSGEDALRLNRNIALSAWMSQVSGQDINAGSATWQQDKDALVQGYFKNPTASNVSDEHLHSIVKTHIQTAEEAADIAANIALQGKPSSEALKLLNAKRGPSLVRGVWDRYTKDALNRHFALASKLSPYRGIIDSAASQLGSEMEWSVPTTQKFQEVAKTLLEVPEADRPLVISAIGATGGATPEERASYLAKLAGAMGRMTETMGASTVGTLEQIGTTFEQLGQVPEAIASALSGGVTMQGELAASKARSEEMLKAKEDQVAFQILTQQIRQVADSEVSPIKGGNWFSQIGVDVARIVPQVAVTVANPTLGTAANLAYFRNTVAAEAKAEDPSLTYEQADAIGSLTAPFNATIETATALIPFGRVKVPLLTKWLSTATTSLRGAARNLALRNVATVASEVGEEMAQAIAPLWTQEALSALQKDMPSVDWERRMPDFSKIAAQTWGPALAFGLVAGGAASISEVSSGRLLTSDRDKLIELGVSPVKADEIAAASVAGDWAKTDALIREDGIFTTATPEEMKEAAAANREEEQRHVAIEEELKRRGELPDVMINPQTGKYRVIDRDGNVLVETDKRADALNVAYSTLEENQRIAAEATVQIFDELMATRGTQAEGAVVSQRRQTAQSLVDEGIVSYDQMMQGAMTAAKADGVSEQQAQIDSSTINGFSRAEYWDQVRTMVSRTFATGGVETAIHETVHNRVRRGMANGTYTREMALEWVRAAERALEGKTDKAGKPIKFLPSENDAEIDDRVLEEAVAELAVADTIGRRKSGTRFTPGLIAQGISARLRAEKNAFLGKTKEERAAARKGGNLARFKLFLQGWKETLGNMLRIARQVQAARQEGKLGEDFDAFLDNLLGTDAQSRYDLQTQQEAKQLLEEGKMPFSMSRAKPADASNVIELPDGAQMVGPTMFSITAYHGTPHKVDKFSLSKIGTGEGAQAYGWGLYFAENQGVAKQYQASVTSKQSGNPASLMWGIYGSGEKYWIENGDLDRRGPFKTRPEAEIALMEAMGEKGNLYTVELLPDADQFLDWDKPLSEQSENVKAIFVPLIEELIARQIAKLNANVSVLAMGLSKKKMRLMAENFLADNLASGAGLYDLIRGLEGNKKGGITPDDMSRIASTHLASIGIPGIRYLDQGSRGAGDGTRNYVIFDESLVKILEENGKPVESPMFSMGKPSIKTAIEVDGKIHTTAGSHYDATLDYIVRQMPAFQREDMEAAREKAGEILTNEWLKEHGVKQGFVVDGEFMTREETLAKVKELGIPTPLADEEKRNWFDSQDIEAMQNIRFSSRSMASVLEAALEAQRRNPEFRERLLKLAVEKAQAIRQDGPMRVNKRGVVSQRQGMDTMAENDRTKANIEAERKFRLRSRQRELIDAGMAQLTPETLAAYDQGLTTLEDNPLINSMLNDHGKLMSKTAAQKAGKLRTDGKGNAGDYDDAPRLPIAWYSKSGGIMPDVMAENLGFDSVPAFWDALRSAIYSTRTANESFKKARDAVRQVEVDALAQATKEANEWAAEAEAKVPTPKEKQLAALRTLDAILSIFPPEIRGKVGGMYQLAKANTDAAREKEILKRVEIIDKVLEKEGVKLYRAKIEKLTDRYKSQKDSSGRISGKLLSTVTEQVDYAVEVMEMTIEQQAEKGAALEKIIEQSDDADEVQDALNRLGILRLFEMFEDKDSASLESAAKWLEATIEQGKLGKRIVDEARKEFLDDMRESAQTQVLEGEALDINEANNLTNMNRGTMRKMVQGLRGALSEALWTTVQRLEILFGEDSKILNYFAGRVVAAANQSNDIKRLISAQQKDILTVIFNTDSKFAHARGIAKLQKARYSGVMLRNVVTKEVKLDIETITKLADGKMSAEAAGLRPDELQTALDEWAASDRKRGVTIKQVVNAGNPVDRYMSELQGIQWRLWWNQADSKKQMERDGWDEDAIKQLDAFLSDEAKQLGDWIANSYNDAAAMIDPIYRRLFNAPLPRIKNYAPIYRMTLATGADVMDLASSDMNSGLAAGFTKSRVNTIAPLMEMDALAAFLAHWENVSHWVSHAELMRDMKAILLDRNTSTAIRQKRGDGALSRLKEDVKTIESNGTNSAKELTNISRWWRWLMQYRAYKGLAFKMSPIIKQTPALLNPLLADVPAHNYMIGLSRAFTSPQEFAASVSAMWKSDEIRRRIEGGFSAEARAAQQGASMSGSQAIALMQAGMMPMAYVDAGWTALGAAVAYDYYKRGYMSQNEQASEAMADAYATGKVERMVATSAQPSDIVNRSLYERSGNLFMRSLSMFVSDQRKALAIELLAIRKLATGKSKNKALDVQRIFVAHFIQAAVSQLMAAVIASKFGDDDDKEREWSTEQWALALALGPVNGLFVLGKLIDKTARLALGLRVFPNNDLAGKAADDLIRGTKSMDELFNPDDAEDVITSLDALSTAAGAIGSAAFGPAAGAVDVSANILREGEKIRKAMAE